jgi:hypothetical protein
MNCIANHVRRTLATGESAVKCRYTPGDVNPLFSELGTPMFLMLVR